MKLRKPLLFVVAGAVVALVMGQVWKPVKYVEQLIRIQAEQELAHLDTAIMDESIEVQGVLLDYAADKVLVQKAWIALSRYPENARTILVAYGAAPEFREIFLNYGEAVIPVIQYFRENDVWTARAADVAARKYDQLRDGINTMLGQLPGREPTVAVPPNASPVPGDSDATRRGWYAVNLIRQEGHDLLGQFVIGRDNAVTRIQTDRFFKAVASLLTGGLRTLETKHELGQDITATDVFWAGLDVAAIAAPLKLFAAGKAVARSGKELSFATRTRLFAPRLVSKSKFFQRLGKYGAIAATIFIIVTHPSLINSVMGEIANVMGLNPWLVQFAGWSLIVALALYPFSWLLKILARAVLAALAWLEHSRRRSARKGRSAALDSTAA